MQADDGEFCNFIYKDHYINTTGRTSKKSFGWWGSRGVWSLGTGYRVFMNVDPVFAGTLKRALERSLSRVKTFYPVREVRHCRRVSGATVAPV